MRDPQTPARAPTGGIFFLSVTLHCLSMPALVFLRRNFGYSYLGPKKIFLALVFACVLFSYAVWHDDSLRPELLFPAIFGAAASTLYLVHLLGAFLRQGQGRAKHDQDSGSSHLLAFSATQERQKREFLLHSLIEPALVVLLGKFAEPHFFGMLLVLSGWSLALKEWIRWWLLLRLQKRAEDGRVDAGELMEDIRPGVFEPVSKSGKTARQRFERNHLTTDSFDQGYIER